MYKNLLKFCIFLCCFCSGLIFSSGELSAASSYHSHKNICPVCDRESTHLCSKEYCLFDTYRLPCKSHNIRIPPSVTSKVANMSYFEKVMAKAPKIKGGKKSGAAIFVVIFLVIAIGAWLFLDHPLLGIVVILVGMGVLYFWLKKQSVGTRLRPPTRDLTSEDDDASEEDDSAEQARLEAERKRRETEERAKQKAEEIRKDAEWREKHSRENLENFFVLCKNAPKIGRCIILGFIYVVLAGVTFNMLWLICSIIFVVIAKKKMSLLKRNVEVNVNVIDKSFLLVNFSVIILSLVFFFRPAENYASHSLFIFGHFLGLLAPVIYAQIYNKSKTMRKYTSIIDDEKTSFTFNDILYAGVAYRDGLHGCNVDLDLAEKCFEVAQNFVRDGRVAERIPGEISKLNELKSGRGYTPSSPVKSSSIASSVASMTMAAAGAAFVPVRPATARPVSVRTEEKTVVDDSSTVIDEKPAAVIDNVREENGKYYYEEGMAFCTGNDGRAVDYDAAIECFEKAAQCGDANLRERAQVALDSVKALR